MVQRWKKYVNKIIKSTNRKGLADNIDDIINSRNLSSYNIIPYEGTKNKYRVRIGDYRIIFEKTDIGNKIIKINKRGDIYN